MSPAARQEMMIVFRVVALSVPLLTLSAGLATVQAPLADGEAIIMGAVAGFVIWPALVFFIDRWTFRAAAWRMAVAGPAAGFVLGLTPAAPLAAVLAPAAVVAAAWWVSVFRGRQLRPRPGFCRGCGYDLGGLVSGRCPECGKAFTRRSPRAAQPSARP